MATYSNTTENKQPTGNPENQNDIKSMSVSNGQCVNNLLDFDLETSQIRQSSQSHNAKSLSKPNTPDNVYEIVMCDSCRNEMAVSECSECSMTFGALCLSVHSRIPATSGHSVKRINEFLSTNPIDVRGTNQNDVNSLLQTLNEHLQKHDANVSSLSQRAATINDKASSLNKLIDESEKVIIAKTTEAHDRIRNKVKLHTDREIDTIRAQTVDISTQQELLKSCAQIIACKDNLSDETNAAQSLASNVLVKSKECLTTIGRVLQPEPSSYQMALPKLEKISKVLRQAKLEIITVSLQTHSNVDTDATLVSIEDHQSSNIMNNGGHFETTNTYDMQKDPLYEPLIDFDPHLRSSLGSNQSNQRPKIQPNPWPNEVTNLLQDVLSTPNPSEVQKPDVQDDNGCKTLDQAKSVNGNQEYANCNPDATPSAQEHASVNIFEEDVFDPDPTMAFSMDLDAISYVEEYEDIDMLLRKTQRANPVSETLPKPRRKSSPNKPLVKSSSYSAGGRTYSHPATSTLPIRRGDPNNQQSSPDGDRLAIYASRQIKRNSLYEFKHVPFAISVVNRNLWVVKSNFSVDIFGFNPKAGTVTKIKTIEVHSNSDGSKRKSWARFLGSGTIVYKTRAVVQTPHGKIIAACLGQLSGQDAKDSRLGLVMINGDGVIERVLASDWYNDVSVDGEFVYGLTGRTITIHKFVQSEWQMMAKKINLDSFYYHLCVNKNIITLSDYASHKVCQMNISSEDGPRSKCKILAKEGSKIGEVKCPRVCGYDQAGHVIICDTRNDRVQRLAPNHTWHAIVCGQNLWPKGAIVIEQGHILVVGLNRSLIRLNTD